MTHADDALPADTTSDAPMVSPYLLRPLRTYEEALADIEARKNRRTSVQPFIPRLVVSNGPGGTVTAAA